MNNHHVDRAVERLARLQDGTFSHEQVLRAGGSDTMVADRLIIGTWIHLDTGVYALPSAPGTFRRQCWAAVLGNPGSAVARFAAAALLRFEDIRAGRVELVVPPTANARSTLARIHRYERPRIMELRGLPITTRAQTIFDIAYRLEFERLEAVV